MIFFLSEPTNSSTEQNLFSLKVLHTNDLHAHITPFNNAGENCSYDTCRGGFARIKTFIDNKRKEDPELLLLDAGDRFSGTIFYTLNKGKNIATLMEKMGYDAMALGNHDFDDDLEELEKFEKTITAPIISSNVQFPIESTLNSNILQMVIIQRKNRKIGILSVLTQETKETCANADKITLLDETKIIKNLIRDLENKGINIIILLNHNGIEEDIMLAKKIPEIDLIISAHSHTLLSNDKSEDRKGPYPLTIKNDGEKSTLIVSAGIGGQHVGEINLLFDKKGNITSFSGNALPMDTSIQPDKETVQYISKIEKEIERTINQPIRRLTQKIPLTKSETFCSESCYMGEILTTALLKAAQTENRNVEIAFLNAGSIRSGATKGEMTFKHIAQIYPFDSKAIITKMTGKDIKKYLNHGLKKYERDDRTNAFLHTSGLSYRFSAESKQILSVKLENGNHLDDKKAYLIVMPSFLGKGGDGFPPVNTTETISFGSINDILIRYFKTEKKLPSFENRIQKTF